MADADILRVNPWEMDDSGYRVLDNRMVVTRYPHDCAICFARIQAGARIRAQREVLDGKAMTFRFCADCCAAMARASRVGDCRPLEARYDIGRHRAAEKEPTR